MSLAGNLKTMPFADILQFLSSNMSTGTLQIRQHQVVKMIFFEKGKIIFSSSSDPKEYLGHFLVSRGLITEDDLRNAMDVQRNSKMLLGKVLVTGGKVTEEEMSRMLQLKAEETVYSLFLWDEGDFTFYKDEFINRLFVRISMDPQAMIFEGVLRKDEWLRIREVFPHNNLVLERVPKRSLDPAGGDPQMQKAYEQVDGIRTVQDIALALHMVEFVACRNLFALYEEGYLRIRKVLGAQVKHELPGGEDHSMDSLMTLGVERMADGRFEEALDMLKEINHGFPNYQQIVAPMVERAERETIRDISKLLPPEKILRLKVPLSDISFSKLTPEEGFLLSRIDGTWDVRSILSVTPMKELDALRLLKKFLDRGIISVG
jgi:hypothetical protein